MIIKLIPPGTVVDTVVYQLPEPNMVVDPRHIYRHSDFKFETVVNGTTMAVKSVERRGYIWHGWDDNILFRIYSRNEFHYSFESTKYLYHGLVNEWAPKDATEIIVKDGIETIREHAFLQCSSLLKITIPDTVTSIEEYAFGGCTSLRCIQLPPNLQHIGRGSFSGCSSLEALYISPTVTHVGDYAFANCKSLRIINAPDNVQIIGYAPLAGCDDLLMDEERNGQDYKLNFLTWLSQYNSLHNLCCHPSATPTDIQQYIQQHHNNHERARTNDQTQFTPLHLLAANPSVTGDMIMAYLQLAPDVAVMQDNKGKTPLHMLCSVPCFFDGTGGAMEAYLGGCSEGKKASFMTDNEGKTPLDCLLFEKHFDELLFLENKRFGGLMTWWYDHCLGINLFAEDVVGVKEN